MNKKQRCHGYLHNANGKTYAFLEISNLEVEMELVNLKSTNNDENEFQKLLLYEV